jgi:hypothetical protein
LDIRTVLDYLSKIDINNLHSTDHFMIRVDERKSDIYPDLNGIIKIILNDTPLDILKQSEDKFKLIYNLNKDYDYIIIISLKKTNPLRINLVSCFPEESRRRRRENVSDFKSQ